MRNLLPRLKIIEFLGADLQLGTEKDVRIVKVG